MSSKVLPSPVTPTEALLWENTEQSGSIANPKLSETLTASWIVSKLDVVVRTFNLSTWKAEAGRLLWV